MSVHVSGASVAFWRTSAVSWSPTSCNIWRQLTTFCSWKRFVFLSRGSETCSDPSADILPVKLLGPMYISTRDSSTLYRSYGPFPRVSVNSKFFFAVCVSQGQIVAQGTYRELQCSDLDIVSLLRSDEEQDQWSQTADPDKQSTHSRSTIPSQSSHCSNTRLLPQESSSNKELPVGTLSPQTPAWSFRISLSISSLHGIPNWIFSSRAEVFTVTSLMHKDTDKRCPTGWNGSYHDGGDSSRRECEQTCLLQVLHCRLQPCSADGHSTSQCHGWGKPQLVCSFISSASHHHFRHCSIQFSPC